MYIPSSPSEKSWLLWEPAVFVPGCFVELVDAADVFVGILPALQQKKCSSFLHGYENNMGALLSISITLKCCQSLC